MRTIAVLVAIVAGAIAGFALAGGSPADALGDPALVTTSGVGPLLGMAAGALLAPWAVNRWFEHDPRQRGQDP